MLYVKPRTSERRLNWTVFYAQGRQREEVRLRVYGGGEERVPYRVPAQVIPASTSLYVRPSVSFMKNTVHLTGMMKGISCSSNTNLVGSQVRTVLLHKFSRFLSSECKEFRAVRPKVRAWPKKQEIVAACVSHSPRRFPRRCPGSRCSWSHAPSQLRMGWLPSL